MDTIYNINECLTNSLSSVYAIVLIIAISVSRMKTAVKRTSNVYCTYRNETTEHHKEAYFVNTIMTDILKHKAITSEMN